MASPKQQLDTIKKKAREERSYMNQNGSLLIGGLVGVGAVSFATTKMPRMKSIDEGGKIPTEPLLAGGLTLLGMASRNYALTGAGMMIGGKWIGDWVSDQTWAQP